MTGRDYLVPVHIMLSLSQPGTGSFVWLPLHQQAFESMKTLLVADTIMHYPDHNSPFHIFTDASDYHLGSVIMQNDLPTAHCSRKLSFAQKKLCCY